MTNDDSHLPFKAPDPHSPNSHSPDSAPAPSADVVSDPSSNTSDSSWSAQEPPNSPPKSEDASAVDPSTPSSVIDSHPPADPQPSPSNVLSSPLPSGIPYSVPDWSGPCPVSGYSLEVLKNGVIISNFDLNLRATHVFGRLPTCHMVLEHPSLSRFHAVIQYRAVAGPNRGQGWYLFDLDSTHGTVVNKIKVRPMEFHRLRVGHVIKFGGSSRLFVVQGPQEDRELESEMTYSQHLSAREKQKADLEARRVAEEKKRQERLSGDCSWGFADDAEEEEPEEIFEMVAEPKHEEQYIKDPKKVLRSYFEREGYDQPEYEFLDAGFGKHHCRVELIPLQSSGTGRTTFAEAVISGGKKKEAVTACALEACRMLDRMGELFKAATSRAQRRMRDWEANEYYDSDEDTFLDRTGDIEKKRARRMAQAGKKVEEEEKNGKPTKLKADTFESLTKEFAALGEQIRNIEETLERSRKQLQGGDNPASSELDALDAYMEGIKAGALDRRSRMALKIKLTEMRRQSEVLRKRLQAVAPNLSVLSMRTGTTTSRASVPPPSAETPATVTETPANITKEEEQARVSSVVKVSQPSTGRMRFSIRNTARKPLSKSALSFPTEQIGNAEVEEEEEEDDDEKEEGENEKNEKMKTNDSSVGRKSSSKPSAIEPQARLEDEKMEEVTLKPVMLPARPQQEEMETEVSLPEDKAKRRKRPRMNISKQKMEEEFPDDPDYVCWMPPQNQTGDGMTALNSRFGY